MRLGGCIVEAHAPPPFNGPRLDIGRGAAYMAVMLEIMRSTDPTEIAFASALLSGEDIEVFEMDVHMSVLEGSIGILPRRLLVRRADAHRARIVLRDNALPVSE
jgi:hypothetical protein